MAQRICVIQRRLERNWIARYGGEEFLLVMPLTHIDDATRVAERLRRAILEMSFSFSGKEVTITASFGVSGIIDWHDHDAVCHETLLNSADFYLYRAKHGGRNMVVAGPPIIN